MSRLIGGTGRWQDARDGRPRHRDPVPEVPSPGAARHGSARPCARDGGGVCMQRERAPPGGFARDPLSRRRLDRPTGRQAVDGGQCRRCALATSPTSAPRSTRPARSSAIVACDEVEAVDGAPCAAARVQRELRRRRWPRGARQIGRASAARGPRRGEAARATSCETSDFSDLDSSK